MFQMIYKAMVLGIFRREGCILLPSMDVPSDGVFIVVAATFADRTSKWYSIDGNDICRIYNEDDLDIVTVLVIADSVQKWLDKNFDDK